MPVSDPEILKKFPTFVYPNVWPSESLPELEPALKELSQLIITVGMLVIAQCDKFVGKHSKMYESGKLTDILSKAKCFKSRYVFQSVF